MLGTFGGALEARQIDASNGKLTAEVTGEVETEDGVLVIRRIHVAMRLVAAEGVRETVERVHGMYAMRCPLYRTLHNAIQLTSSYTLHTPADDTGRRYVLGRREDNLNLERRSMENGAGEENSADVRDRAVQTEDILGALAAIGRAGEGLCCAH